MRTYVFVTVILLFFFLLYPSPGFATPGKACHSAYSTYRCIAFEDKGDRVAALDYPQGSPGMECKTDANQIAVDEVCASAEAPPGYLGGRCMNFADRFAEGLKDNVGGVNGVINGDGTKSCLLFGKFICPFDTFSSIINGAGDTVYNMIGIDLKGNNPSFACAHGKPSTYNPDTGTIDNLSECKCIDPERQLLSGVQALCLKYVSGMPDRAAKSARFSNPSIWSQFKDTVQNVAGNSIDNSILARLARLPQDMVTGYLSLSPEESAAIQAEISGNSKAFASCIKCANSGGYYSAVGCIPMKDTASVISTLAYTIGLGLAGAYCTICIIISAIRMQLSAGDAEGIGKASQTLRSCVMGLIMIIFSIFIIRFIGVDLLKINGL